MNAALVRGEARKLRTVRSVTGLAAGVVALAFIALAPAWTSAESAKADWTADSLLQALRGPAFAVALAMLIVGVLATAGELRHRTLASTLVVAPRRRQVVMAKLVVVVAMAAALALVVSLVTLAMGTAMLTSAGIEVSPFSSDSLATVGAVVAVVAAYGALGVGLGLIGRDQTAVLVAALVWSTVVENMVPVVLRAPELDRWTLGGAARSLLHVATPEPTLADPGAAALVLVAVVGLFVAAGTATFGRRDVQ